MRNQIVLENTLMFQLFLVFVSLCVVSPYQLRFPFSTESTLHMST